MRISDWSSDVCSSDLSLQTSQAIKQDSDQIVDSIVAEDIGKLPDVTATESLARIAGVQVDYANGTAAGTRVRGLPDIATTYNGRELFTGQGRAVALQDFPSSSIARIDVYKSGSARSEEHTSELQSLMRTSYAVLCFTKTKRHIP